MFALVSDEVLNNGSIFPNVGKGDARFSGNGYASIDYLAYRHMKCSRCSQDSGNVAQTRHHCLNFIDETPAHVGWYDGERTWP